MYIHTAYNLILIKNKTKKSIPITIYTCLRSKVWPVFIDPVTNIMEKIKTTEVTVYPA